ncbi:MAG: hypothetical protein ACFCUS_10305 [Rubrimonas sp.]
MGAAIGAALAAMLSSRRRQGAAA